MNFTVRVQYKQSLIDSICAIILTITNKFQLFHHFLSLTMEVSRPNFSSKTYISTVKSALKEFSALRLIQIQLSQQHLCCNKICQNLTVRHLQWEQFRLLI